MKASDIRLDSPQSMLFKGPFGFGKTLAALSFAIEGPVHLSYWDKKQPIEMLTYFTYKRFGDKAKKVLDNITFDTYSAENANDYLNWLIQMVTRGCPYYAIINDSLTFMTASAVNWSLNFGKDPKLNKKIKDILPDWDEYKVETSLITQCIDLCKKLPCHSIWTAHPLPTTQVTGTGSSMRVSKINSLVSYGSKVAGMVPGSFTEIYHFTQQADWNPQAGSSAKKFIVSLEALGDEFAKSPLIGGNVKELDFTDKLFYEVWIDAVTKARKEIIEQPQPPTEQKPNPFAPKPVEQQSNETKWRV